MNSVKMLSTLVVLLCSMQLSLGHMYLASLTINGASTTSCLKPKASGDFTAPVANLNNQVLETTQNMVCGAVGVSTPASSKCSVAAGSSMSLYWAHNDGSGNNDVVDPSHVGPCMVYLAQSDSGAGNVWFKIYEEGYVNNQWCTIRLKSTGGKLDFTIPAGIPNGNYLLRAETIALHEADRLGGAQPYVQCAEITITGGGSNTPSPVVAFPGAYKNSDAGIHFNPYANPIPPYPVPGPAVYKSSVSPSTPTNAPSSPSSSPSSPSPSVTPSTSGSVNCTVGAEKCGCKTGKTCNSGLACLSDICVDAGSLLKSTGYALTPVTLIKGVIVGLLLCFVGFF